MDAPQMRTLDGPFEIGAHTLDHAYASRCTPTDWAHQVRQGKLALEERLGHRVRGFCYPGGKRGPNSRQTVIDCGFDFARTVDNFYLHPGRDPYLMPTSLQFYPHTVSVMMRNYASRGNWARRFKALQATLLAGSFGQRLDSMLREALQDDAVLHLWGHSWEIEAQGLWPILSDFFAAVASQVPKAQRLDNVTTLEQLQLLPLGQTGKSA
jgi:hypothetical protein